MGQARNRKAEIDTLKAQGPRAKIKRFMVRGEINPDGTVTFPTQDLDPAQRDFVESCERVINTQQVPEMVKQGRRATPDDALAYVMYNTNQDYASSLAIGLTTTPDQAWQLLYSEFAGKTQGFPKIGDTYSRDQLVKKGSEQAGIAMDLLVEGGIWPWPNAHAVFQRRGNQMVVIDTI